MLDVDLSWVPDADLGTLICEAASARVFVDELRSADALARDDVALLMDAEALRVQLMGEVERRVRRCELVAARAVVHGEGVTAAAAAVPALR